jgi:hypothetical protein
MSGGVWTVTAEDVGDGVGMAARIEVEVDLKSRAGRTILAAWRAA